MIRHNNDDIYLISSEYSCKMCIKKPDNDLSDVHNYTKSIRK